MPDGIVLDAADWHAESDFYDSLLAALGAPDWHGRGIDALIDSMVTGHINRIDSPYLLAIENSSAMAPALNASVRSILGDVVNSALEAGRGADWLRVEYR